MSDTTAEIYFTHTQARAVFAPDGPKPQFLVDSPNLKALVVGLEAGQQIPLHADKGAMYHFLQGTGLMTVGTETFAIQPDVTVIVPDGAARGMNAKTRIVFLACKGG